MDKKKKCPETVENAESLSLVLLADRNQLVQVYTATYCTGMCNFRVSCTLHSSNCKKKQEKHKKKLKTHPSNRASIGLYWPLTLYI